MAGGTEAGKYRPCLGHSLHLLAKAIGDAFATTSKPLIAEKEFHPDLSRYKREHEGIARRTIQKILGTA